MPKSKKTTLLDEYVQIEESYPNSPSELSLTIDFKAPHERRNQLTHLARRINHGYLIGRHFLLSSTIDDKRSYDAIHGPWVAHIKKVYKSFLILKIAPALEKKLNFLEILIDAMVEEKFISYIKAKNLVEKIKKMAETPRQNIHLALVSEDKDFNNYPLEPIITEPTKAFNEHYKHLVSILSQKNSTYNQTHKTLKKHDILYHYNFLKGINAQLDEELSAHKKAIAIITPQNPQKFAARNVNGFFESKNMALSYHQTCLREIETMQEKFIKIKL